LEELSNRIEQAKAAEAPTSKMEDHHSQAHLAWRMVIELVTGIVIGFGIGYGLDALFGTLPIFLVLFVLLGFAAGVRVMLRSATEIQEKDAAEAAEDDEGN
jgi:ATP synthase protein I